MFFGENPSKALEKELERLKRVMSSALERDNPVYTAISGSIIGINNGYITFHALGEGKEEAIRVFDPMLKFAQQAVDPDERWPRRKRPIYEAQELSLSVPEDKIPAFTEALRGSLDRIEQSKPLQEQYRQAVHAMSLVARIPGAKAYPQFFRDEVGDMQAKLHLADLPAITVQLIATFMVAATGETPEVLRDRLRLSPLERHPGKKDMVIPLSDPRYINAALRQLTRAADQERGEVGHGRG